MIHDAMRRRTGPAAHRTATVGRALTELTWLEQWPMPSTGIGRWYAS